MRSTFCMSSTSDFTTSPHHMGIAWSRCDSLDRLSGELRGKRCLSRAKSRILFVQLNSHSQGLQNIRQCGSSVRKPSCEVRRRVQKLDSSQPPLFGGKHQLYVVRWMLRACSESPGSLSHSPNRGK